MTMRGMLVGCLAAVCATQGGLLSATAVAGEFVVYKLQATSDVTLSLPGSPGGGRILMLDAEQKWRPVAHETTPEGVRLTIKAVDLDHGRTMLAFNVPARVDMTDRSAPEVVSVAVDGNEKGAVNRVDLGGVGEPPNELVVRIRDAQNALVSSSLRVTVNGMPAPAGQKPSPVRYTPEGKRAATVRVSLTAFREALGSKNTVSISIDDEALDEEELRVEVLFSWVKPHTLADGTVLAVDSVTGSSGWAEWWVVSDDVIMDEGYGTTAGYTWLSEETNTAHWLSITFPEPRSVSKVTLWWSYYQCYRTSRAYSVQTWDGNGWVTQVTVDGQAEKQSSQHSFAPLTTTGVRVWQPADSGQAGRAGYMWLSEFDVE